MDFVLTEQSGRVLKDIHRRYKMKQISAIGISALALLCLFSGNAAGQTLIDTFNEIYESCLVHLSVDCVQPKTYEWFNRALQQSEIYITDDLTIVKNSTSDSNENTADQAEESARNSQFNVIAQVDDFLSTHYLNIRYPKAIINSHVPSFVVSTVDSLIPDDVQIQLQESSVSEGMKTNCSFSSFILEITNNFTYFQVVVSLKKF